MTSRADPPPGTISYRQFLINQINEPGVICGPDVIDDRPWWQHLPGLNPYAGLEAQARQASRARRAQADGPCVGGHEPVAEAEAG